MNRLRKFSEKTLKLVNHNGDVSPADAEASPDGTEGADVNAPTLDLAFGKGDFRTSIILVSHGRHVEARADTPQSNLSKVVDPDTMKSHLENQRKTGRLTQDEVSAVMEQYRLEAMGLSPVGSPAQASEHLSDAYAVNRTSGYAASGSGKSKSSDGLERSLSDRSAGSGSGQGSVMNRSIKTGNSMFGGRVPSMAEIKRSISSSTTSLASLKATGTGRSPAVAEEPLPVEEAAEGGLERDLRTSETDDSQARTNKSQVTTDESSSSTPYRSPLAPSLHLTTDTPPLSQSPPPAGASHAAPENRSTPPAFVVPTHAPYHTAQASQDSQVPFPGAYYSESEGSPDVRHVRQLSELSGNERHRITQVLDDFHSQIFGVAYQSPMPGDFLSANGEAARGSEPRDGASDGQGAGKLYMHDNSTTEGPFDLGVVYSPMPSQHVTSPSSSLSHRTIDGLSEGPTSPSARSTAPPAGSHSPKMIGGYETDSKSRDSYLSSPSGSSYKGRSMMDIHGQIDRLSLSAASTTLADGDRRSLDAYGEVFSTERSNGLSAEIDAPFLDRGAEEQTGAFVTDDAGSSHVPRDSVVIPSLTNLKEIQQTLITRAESKRQRSNHGGNSSNETLQSLTRTVRETTPPLLDDNTALEQEKLKPNAEAHSYTNIPKANDKSASSHGLSLERQHESASPEYVNQSSDFEGVESPVDRTYFTDQMRSIPSLGTVPIVSQSFAQEAKHGLAQESMESDQFISNGNNSLAASNDNEGTSALNNKGAASFDAPEGRTTLNGLGLTSAGGLVSLGDQAQVSEAEAETEAEGASDHNLIPAAPVGAGAGAVGAGLLGHLTTSSREASTPEEGTDAAADSASLRHNESHSPDWTRGEGGHMPTQSYASFMHLAGRNSEYLESTADSNMSQISHSFAPSLSHDDTSRSMRASASSTGASASHTGHSFSQNLSHDDISPRGDYDRLGGENEKEADNIQEFIPVRQHKAFAPDLRGVSEKSAFVQGEAENHAGHPMLASDNVDVSNERYDDGASLPDPSEEGQVKGDVYEGRSIESEAGLPYERGTAESEEDPSYSRGSRDIVSTTDVPQTLSDDGVRQEVAQTTVALPGAAARSSPTPDDFARLTPSRQTTDDLSEADSAFYTPSEGGSFAADTHAPAINVSGPHDTDAEPVEDLLVASPRNSATLHSYASRDSFEPPSHLKSAFDAPTPSRQSSADPVGSARYSHDTAESAVGDVPGSPEGVTSFIVTDYSDGAGGESRLFGEANASSPAALGTDASDTPGPTHSFGSAGAAVAAGGAAVVAAGAAAAAVTHANLADIDRGVLQKRLSDAALASDAAPIMTPPSASPNVGGDAFDVTPQARATATDTTPRAPLGDGATLRAPLASHASPGTSPQSLRARRNNATQSMLIRDVQVQAAFATESLKGNAPAARGSPRLRKSRSRSIRKASISDPTFVSGPTDIPAVPILGTDVEARSGGNTGLGALATDRPAASDRGRRSDGDRSTKGRSSSISSRFRKLLHTKPPVPVPVPTRPVAAPRALSPTRLATEPATEPSDGKITPYRISPPAPAHRSDVRAAEQASLGASVDAGGVGPAEKYVLMSPIPGLGETDNAEADAQAGRKPSSAGSQSSSASGEKAAAAAAAATAVAGATAAAAAMHTHNRSGSSSSITRFLTRMKSTTSQSQKVSSSSLALVEAPQTPPMDVDTTEALSSVDVASPTRTPVQYDIAAPRRKRYETDTSTMQSSPARGPGQSDSLSPVTSVESLAGTGDAKPLARNFSTSTAVERPYISDGRPYATEVLSPTTKGAFHEYAQNEAFADASTHEQTFSTERNFSDSTVVAGESAGFLTTGAVLGEADARRNTDGSIEQLRLAAEGLGLEPASVQELVNLSYNSKGASNGGSGGAIGGAAAGVPLSLRERRALADAGRTHTRAASGAPADAFFQQRRGESSAQQAAYGDARTPLDGQSPHSPLTPLSPHKMTVSTQHANANRHSLLHSPASTYDDRLSASSASYAGSLFDLYDDEDGDGRNSRVVLDVVHDLRQNRLSRLSVSLPAQDSDERDDEESDEPQELAGLAIPRLRTRRVNTIRRKANESPADFQMRQSVWIRDEERLLMLEQQGGIAQEEQGSFYVR